MLISFSICSLCLDFQFVGSTGNDNMKQLINKNNTTMTKTLNENINEKFKDFQTTLMKKSRRNDREANEYN